MLHSRPNSFTSLSFILVLFFSFFSQASDAHSLVLSPQSTHLRSDIQKRAPLLSFPSVCCAARFDHSLTYIIELLLRPRFSYPVSVLYTVGATFQTLL